LWVGEVPAAPTGRRHHRSIIAGRYAGSCRAATNGVRRVTAADLAAVILRL